MKRLHRLAGHLDTNRIALKGGSYALALTAVVLAILFVLNVLVSALPASMTQYDISASKLSSITSNTKVVVNGLEDDITIYWIVQSGAEDDVLDNLLSQYESLSDHIEVVKRNPDVYPTFAEQYTSETVQNNSLVVECGDRYRYIGYDDIYLQQTDPYSYTYSTSFDGEGAITSAIDYVVTDELPQLYLLEGHGEQELPQTFSDQVEKENIEVNTLSLLNIDEIPAEADCIMIYGPSSDISAEEKQMLADYAEGGGKLLVMAGPTEEGTLVNLYSLLADYGVQTYDGIVVEGDRSYYAFQPYVLMPEVNSSDLTDSLIEERYYPLVPTAQGLTVDEDAQGVTELLTTSSAAFSKAAGYALTTYEKEDGDTNGPFSVAVSIECGSGGQIVWFSSSSFLDDAYNAWSSGANNDLAINALSDLIGESEAMAIRSKSLNYNYLTISDSTASLLKVLMIGICPLAYLGVGIYCIVRRRRAQHEAG